LWSRYVTIPSHSSSWIPHSHVDMYKTGQDCHQKRQNPLSFFRSTQTQDFSPRITPGVLLLNFTSVPRLPDLHPVFKLQYPPLSKALIWEKFNTNHSSAGSIARWCTTRYRWLSVNTVLHLTRSTSSRCLRSSSLYQRFNIGQVTDWDTAWCVAMCCRRTYSDNKPQNLTSIKCLDASQIIAYAQLAYLLLWFHPWQTDNTFQLLEMLHLSVLSWTFIYC